MKHVESRARNEKIVQLRREGAKLVDLAEQFKMPLPYLQSILKSCGLHKLRQDEKVRPKGFCTGTLKYRPGDVVPTGRVVAIIITEAAITYKVKCRDASHFTHGLTQCFTCKNIKEGRNKRAATTRRKAQNTTRQS